MNSRRFTRVATPFAFVVLSAISVAAAVGVLRQPVPAPAADKNAGLLEWLAAHEVPDADTEEVADRLGYGLTRRNDWDAAVERLSDEQRAQLGQNLTLLAPTILREALEEFAEIASRPRETGDDDESTAEVAVATDVTEVETDTDVADVAEAEEAANAPFDETIFNEPGFEGDGGESEDGEFDDDAEPTLAESDFFRLLARRVYLLNDLLLKTRGGRTLRTRANRQLAVLVDEAAESASPEAQAAVPAFLEAYAQWNRRRMTNEFRGARGFGGRREERRRRFEDGP